LVLLIFGCQFDRASDVLALRGFVAAGQQEQQPVTAWRVVDAVAGADIALQLGDSVGEAAVTARVAMNQSLDAHLDAGSSDAVGEAADPVSIGRGLLDTHG